MLLGLIFLNLDLISSEDAGLWDPQVHVLTPELWGKKSLSRHPQNPAVLFPLTFWHYHPKQQEDSQAGMGSHG